MTDLTYEAEVEGVVRRADGTIKSREWARYRGVPGGTWIKVDEVIENGDNS
jgi:hypothetical protein